MLGFVVKLVVPLIMILGKTLSVSCFLIFFIVFQKSCASEALSILDRVFQSGLCASEHRGKTCFWISFLCRVSVLGFVLYLAVDSCEL